MNLHVTDQHELHLGTIQMQIRFKDFESIELNGQKFQAVHEKRGTTKMIIIYPVTVLQSSQ